MIKARSKTVKLSDGEHVHLVGLTAGQLAGLQKNKGSIVSALQMLMYSIVDMDGNRVYSKESIANLPMWAVNELLPPLLELNGLAEDAVKNLPAIPGNVAHIK